MEAQEGARTTRGSQKRGKPSWRPTVKPKNNREAVIRWIIYRTDGYIMSHSMIDDACIRPLVGARSVALDLKGRSMSTAGQGDGGQVVGGSGLPASASRLASESTWTRVQGINWTRSRRVPSRRRTRHLSFSGFSPSLAGLYAPGLRYV